MFDAESFEPANLETLHNIGNIEGRRCELFFAVEYLRIIVAPPFLFSRAFCLEKKTRKEARRLCGRVEMENTRTGDFHNEELD